MTRKELIENIARKRSFLCVGLDSDPLKLPKSILDTAASPAQAMLNFNKAIVDATAPYCVAYKPNTAFYEALGAEGWKVLAQTIEYIRKNHPDQFIIADAKRGKNPSGAISTLIASFRKQSIAQSVSPTCQCSAIFVSRRNFFRLTETAGPPKLIIRSGTSPMAEYSSADEVKRKSQA